MGWKYRLQIIVRIRTQTWSHRGVNNRSLSAEMLTLLLTLKPMILLFSDSHHMLLHRKWYCNHYSSTFISSSSFIFIFLFISLKINKRSNPRLNDTEEYLKVISIVLKHNKTPIPDIRFLFLILRQQYVHSFFSVLFTWLIIMSL